MVVSFRFYLQDQPSGKPPSRSRLKPQKPQSSRINFKIYLPQPSQLPSLIFFPILTSLPFFASSSLSWSQHRSVCEFIPSCCLFLVFVYPLSFSVMFISILPGSFLISYGSYWFHVFSSWFYFSSFFCVSSFSSFFSVVCCVCARMERKEMMTCL